MTIHIMGYYGLIMGDRVKSGSPNSSLPYLRRSVEWEKERPE